MNQVAKPVSNLSEVDIGLEVIMRISPPGYTWTHRDIAYVCGCSKNYIYEIEYRAKRKLRRNILVMQLMQAFNELDTQVVTR